MQDMTLSQAQDMVSNLSNARLDFFRAADQYGKDQGIDPRFRKSILEDYVVSLGGSRWDVTESIHDEYQAFRLVNRPKKSSVIPD